jgi:uncharacterized protein (DUF885 family)
MHQSWVRSAAVWIALLCTVSGHAATPAGGEKRPPPALEFDASLSPMRARVERFSTDWAALLRCYDVALSDNRRQRLEAFYRQQSDALKGVDFDKLDQAGRIDYLLLRNKIEFESKQLAHRKEHDDEIASLIPFAPPIIGLEEARARLDPMDAEQSARTLSSIDKQVTESVKNLDTAIKAMSQSAQKPVLLDRAARAVDSLRYTLKTWHEFYDTYDPQFTWWMKQTYPKVDTDLYTYATALRKHLGEGSEGGEDPVVGDPIGREALLDALAAEMIPYTPEELITLAEREFAWCEKEMKRASNDLGVGDDWHKALERVSEMHVKPGEQPALIKRLAEEATQFVEERDLVTVPPLCKEIWRMEMMTPQRQKVNPYFTGGEVISISYPTDSMSFEDKEMSMRGNNPAFCRATVFHELIPGHHLQIFMSERYNQHRQLFRTPFLVEGWALYWEMRMWDLKFPRTPEERVGMLFWRAHRCARIIFSLKFHLGQMTAPQAIDFLVNRVGHERRNATAEVRRSVNGSYGPLYQAAYMLGGLQLRALHNELVDSGKMTERAFHDAVLRENAIPIEMIRASLSGAQLTRDFKSNWRFYGPAVDQ